jgi:HsdM N-terminal domain
MFEQVFRNIDDVLRKEAGCTTELDYTEQTSWLLFLKYLDDLEHDRAMEPQRPAAATRRRGATARVAPQPDAEAQAGKGETR